MGWGSQMGVRDGERGSRIGECGGGMRGNGWKWWEMGGNGVGIMTSSLVFAIAQ